MTAAERFLNYVRYPTMSDDTSTTNPSTKKQLKLASLIKEEMTALGLSDVKIDEFGYVYATLMPNTDTPTNTIGFIAHMDTALEAADENVKARVIRYDGGDILLNEEKSIYMRVKDFPYLDDYKGHELIVTDATTLLGADDKAGIAEILSAIEKIINSADKHGKVVIAFTPDEEIGRGADHFDVKGFGADYAYTVDGGKLGELEFENFNAASAKAAVHGISIHPGTAKDKMKNASLIACEFNSLLPRDEIPAKTDGYEGFFHLLSMSGEIELAELNYIIRDHDANNFAKRKALFENAAKQLNLIYGEGTVEVEIKDSYYNMRERIEPVMYIVDRAKRAMLDEEVTPIVNPIRGGTDGAKLSFLGLPCPNLCTGARNCHSRFEFISVNDMEKTADILVRIIKNAVNEGIR